jgi:hypothetical protein
VLKDAEAVKDWCDPDLFKECDLTREQTIEALKFV